MSDEKGRVQLSGIRKRFGAFEALKGIDIEIAPREFFAFLGASGSGKSTTLRVIAGLEPPDEGVMTVDGVDVTYATPGERDIAMVFQNYALYPHMTLAENIGFPLRMDKVPKDQIGRLVLEAAQKVKIDKILDRRPGQISGGQQQRCALARAIVRKPRLFLLDEPLSNLDAKLRLETRGELKRLHAGMDVTTIYVTHDQEEAMTLADRIAIFREGEILQIGTPDEVFNRPDTTEVAAFIGSPAMNLLEGDIAGGAIRIAGHPIAEVGAYPVAEGRIIVGIRPSHMRIGHAGLLATITLAENLGEAMQLELNIDGQSAKARVPDMRRFAEGEVVHLIPDPGKIHLFNPETRGRIERTAPTASST